MKHRQHCRAGARPPLHITGDRLSTGSDEARTREWVAQRNGRPLDELQARPLLRASGALNRGLDRRNGHASAA